MPGYRVISSDSHVIEPPDLWISRVEPRFRDRAPHIVSEEDADRWHCDDVKVTSVSVGAKAGVRFESIDKLSQGVRSEEVIPGGYIPDEHIKDLDADGVYAGLLYPSVGFLLYNAVKDSELLTALFRTYNDWVPEFCKPYPDRLKGIALLNVDEVEVGVKELERCAKLGFSGAMIPVYPVSEKPYEMPEYEPLWATAQDLDMPLSLHVLTNRPGPGQENTNLTTSRSFQCNQDHCVKMSLGHMIYSGVFERYPKLIVGSVEHELGWAPFFLERLDYTYTQRAQKPEWHRYKEDMLPSDYFRRNIFLSFQEDGLGIKLRDIIGVDNLLWGSDYPHPESTFPRSQQILQEILEDCTEEEKGKIAGGNAARVYHLD